jgi:D-alanyl-D-alanine carboxypeptidase (penicillin-binding protein 5/6)
MDLDLELVAPLELGTPVGQVNVLLAGNPLLNIPVVALQQVVEGGVWTKLRDGISLWME